MRCRLAIVIGLLVVAASCGPRAAGPDGGPGDVDAPAGDDAADADLGPDADLCTGGTLCGVPVTCCPAGNECVLDQCVPTCATGTYCGVDSELCCATGEVCLGNACVAPTTACSDPYDCQPGEFCEPTLDQCLPQPDPLTCQLTPVFADLQVTLERKYESTAVGVMTQVLDREIISIPVVANLDGVGAPEIVVNLSNQDGGSFQVGRIAILDGATLTEKVAPIPHNPPTSYGSQGRSTIAIGDVSGDTLPDVIYAARADSSTSFRSTIVAIDGTGALLWTSHLTGSTTAYGIRVDNGAITLANFDADAMTEIVIGGAVLDHDGTVLFDPAQGANAANAGYGGWLGSNGTYNGGVAAVADLDGDGKPEIVSGKNAWKVDLAAATKVTPFWTYAGNDGYPAIADLDANGTPEVVLTAASQVIVLDGQTGALFCAQASCPTAGDRVQPITLPGGTTNNRGGPPTIADFDGDGRPEIGVAGGTAYSVYDLYRAGEDITGVSPTPTLGQLFVRWTKTTKDTSSNVTGSSVFDFQGDGSAEVIYQDECNVWVYSGTDGRTQLQLPNTTGTIHEYPLVVDADGDGNSEILVVGNATNAAGDCPRPPLANGDPDYAHHRSGLYVFGDTNDRWVPTRKVWTQHTYHVTNATTAGNVPLAEANNWATPGLNDYRKNAQGEGVFNAPDLAVDLAVGLEGCATSTLSLRARVTNRGALGVFPGTTVQFRAGGPTGTVLGAGTVTTPLLPGQSAIVVLDVPTSAGTDFYAGVDGAPGAGAVAECDELNNQDTATGATCPVIL